MRYSVLLPHRGRLRHLEPQLAEIEAFFDAQGSRYEMLLLTEGTVAPERSASRLVDRFPQLRIIQVVPPSGLSAAWLAGVEQAHGEILVALESGGSYQMAETTRLLARLCRADLVVGRRRRTGWSKWSHRLATWPELALVGAEVHDPGCGIWVAYREALNGMELPVGMHRYLPWLVALRGYRVHEVFVTEGSGQHHHTPQTATRWADTLALWWRQRRQREFQIREFRPRRREQVADTDDTNWRSEAA